MTAKDPCFCDLAPLYVLDLLDAEQRQWVEEQAAADPELALELTELQGTTATIAYSATDEVPAADLKSRLFDALGCTPPPQQSLTQQSIAEPALTSAPDDDFRIALETLFVRSQEQVWRSGKTPGVMVSILHTDPIKREIVGLLKAEPGVHYPHHRHATVEEIFMLEGDLVVAGAVYRQGDYIRSASGSGHGPHTTEGCMFFFRTSMDDEYPDPG
jgi:hypothetical protein